MSADNWTHCPFCLSAAQAEFEAAHQRLNDAYSNVPVDEYMRMFNETPHVFDPEPVERTFREDYDIGLDEGTTEIVASYSGGCRECGASVKVSGVNLATVPVPSKKR